MYAVIRTGGKQYKVEAGRAARGRAPRRSTTAPRSSSRRSSSSTATPCWPRRRSSAAPSVKAKVVGETKGPKIDGFIYKPKSNNRRR